MEISTHISHDHIILCLMGINFFRTCFWHVTTTNKSYFSNLIYMCIYFSLCHISVITNMMAVFVNCTQSSLHMHVCLYLIVDKPLVVWLFYDWWNLSYFILIMVNILSICEQCFWLCRNFKHKLFWNNSFRTPPKVLLQTTLYFTSRTPHISYKSKNQNICK